MIDRTANLRAIVTGRGNSADFTKGARAFHKKQAHSRMRKAGKQQIAEQLEEMQLAIEERQAEQYERDLDWILSDDPIARDDEWIALWIAEEQEKRDARNARRRQRYAERKAERQVARYKKLFASLKLLDSHLEPEARNELSRLGMLLQLS